MPLRTGTHGESNHITLWRTAGLIRPRLVHEPGNRQEPTQGFWKDYDKDKMDTSSMARGEERHQDGTSSVTPRNGQEDSFNPKSNGEETKPQPGVGMAHQDRKSGRISPESR